jgi:hypothetical protein
MQQERRQQRQDLLPRLLQDWSLHPVLQADLQLAIALTLALGQALAVAQPLQVVPAVAEAVLVQDL